MIYWSPDTNFLIWWLQSSIQRNIIETLTNILKIYKKKKKPKRRKRRKRWREEIREEEEENWLLHDNLKSEVYRRLQWRSNVLVEFKWQEASISSMVGKFFPVQWAGYTVLQTQAWKLWGSERKSPVSSSLGKAKIIWGRPGIHETENEFRVLEV